MIFLDLDSLLYIATGVLDGDPVVRDAGLLESALARPQASASGRTCATRVDLVALLCEVCIMTSNLVML